VQLQEGSILRFRCHTGHAFTVESLLSAISESIDDTWWTTVRVLNEQLLLLRHLAQHAREQQEEGLAQRFAQEADQVEQRIQLLRQLALIQGHPTPEHLRPSTSSLTG
jgi:two-component system chemotaxis response regulator CheB